MTSMLIMVIVIAIIFDFTNGFHDTANSIATMVGTRALDPKVAVIYAAILICWKDIYTQLEEAIDSCERAASILEQVGVKNS